MQHRAVPNESNESTLEVFCGLGNCHKFHWRVDDCAKAAAQFHEQISLELLEGSCIVLELCDFGFLACNPLLPSQFHILRDSVPNAPLLDGCGHARVWHRGCCLCCLWLGWSVCYCFRYPNFWMGGYSFPEIPPLWS